MRYLTIIAYLVFYASSVYSAPSKPTFSGTASQGSTVTISGSGFGTKSPAKPYLWAPFEGSINPSSLGTVTSWEDNENMTYTSSEGVGGTGGAKGANNTGPWTLVINSSGFKWNDYSQRTYLFRKKKMNFDESTMNWKTWRIWPTSVGTAPDFYFEPDNGCAYTEDVMVSCSDFNGEVFMGSLNTWHTEEFALQANTGSTSSNGTLLASSDGVTGANLSNLKLKNDSRTMEKNFVVHGVWASGSSMPGNAMMWMDDVYADITWARVMIGNANTWAGSTHREPLIPSAWSDTSITASFNAGTFATDNTVYLYVVDSSGNVSPASDPITIGAGSGDTTAPSTTISTSDPSSISSDSLTVTGSASDAVGVSGCKWRKTSAPDANNGTACTGTTSFSCSTSGYSSGSNTMYVGCYDAAGNYGSDSITVNYTPASTVSLGSVLLGR